MHTSFAITEAHALLKIVTGNGFEFLCTLSGLMSIRFPFRILQGTVELELKAKSASFGEGGETYLCPTLFVSDPETYPDNVVAARSLDLLDRSRTLALLQGKPTIEVCEAWCVALCNGHRKLGSWYSFILYRLAYCGWCRPSTPCSTVSSVYNTGNDVLSTIP